MGVDAILLAAGASSRAGSPKGLIAVDGEAWIERQIASLAREPVARVIVVLGHARDRYLAALPWLAEALQGDTLFAGIDVRATVNPDPERGPFSSLQCGLSQARGAVFVLPIDVPCAPVLAALEAALVSPTIAAQPSFDGRGGHPVLLSSSFADELCALPLDDPGARLDVQLRARRDRVARVAVDDARVTMNLNTMDDFAAFGAALERAGRAAPHDALSRPRSKIEPRR